MILFAKITTESTFIDQINYMMICFILVCLVLSVMWAMTSFIGVFFKNACKKKCAARADAHGKSGNLAADSKTTAVISSAVYSVLKDTPHRIVSVSPSTTPVIISAAVAAVFDGAAHRIVSVKPVDFNWANSGRNSIFSSKNPKK